MRSRVLAVCSKIQVDAENEKSSSGVDDLFVQMKTTAKLKDSPALAGRLFFLDNVWGNEYTNLIR